MDSLVRKTITTTTTLAPTTTTTTTTTTSTHKPVRSTNTVSSTTSRTFYHMWTTSHHNPKHGYSTISPKKSEDNSYVVNKIQNTINNDEDDKNHNGLPSLKDGYSIEEDDTYISNHPDYEEEEHILDELYEDEFDMEHKQKSSSAFWSNSDGATRTVSSGFTIVLTLFTCIMCRAVVL